MVTLVQGRPALADGEGGVFVRGIVRDSLSLEGLPYASVRVDGGSASAVADGSGIFEFTVPWGTSSITASCQGYAARTVPLKNRG